MLFNSYIFIFLFLPSTLIGYYIFNRFQLYKTAQGVLVLNSLFFYGYFNFSYLWIIVSSILFNFTINKLLHKEYKTHTRKLILAFAIVANLGMFMYFKYTNFFIDNINVVLKTDYFVEQILLPLGISFFTFQQVSYIIDSYRKEVPNYSFLNYATFVAFFPQLIAGPIVLHDEIIPQFEDVNNKKLNYENFAKGIKAFAFGLAKKVLIADVFGRVVTLGYADVGALNSASAILVMLSYTFQIYFDFSGYCDMATGLGLMFNINITQNFNSPYRALTITDFWKRWHMTLTRFFRRYLYFPLGGNRKGEIRTFVNIFIVFVVSGIWHGANWTFILWGIMHGLAYVFTKKFENYINKLHPAFNWIATFVFINITWVYFRASSIGEANSVLKHAFALDFGSIPHNIAKIFRPDLFINIITGIGNIFDKVASLPNALFMVIAIIFVLFAILCMRNTNERIEAFKPKWYSSVIVAILLVLSIISLSGVSTFLYFNF